MAAVGPQSMAILENQEMMMRWSQQVTLYSLGTGLKRRSAAQVSRYIFYLDTSIVSENIFDIFNLIMCQNGQIQNPGKVYHQIL